jgi:hypothetical protein
LPSVEKSNQFWTSVPGSRADRIGRRESCGVSRLWIIGLAELLYILFVFKANWGAASSCLSGMVTKCGTGRLGTCYYAYSCLYIPAWERPQKPPLAGRSAFVRSVGVSGCYCTKRRMATAMPAWESAYNTGPASRAGNGGDTTEAWFLVLSDGLLTLDFERVLGTRFMGGQFANYKAPFVFLLSAVASVIWRLFEPSLYGS